MGLAGLRILKPEQQEETNEERVLRKMKKQAKKKRKFMDKIVCAMLAQDFNLRNEPVEAYDRAERFWEIRRRRS